MKKIFLILVVLLSGSMPWDSARAEKEAGLAAALQATLTRHPSLGGKRAEVEAKAYAGDSARALRYPSLSAQLASQRSSNYVTNTASTANTTVLRARQPIWAFGRIDNAIAYADADLSAEKADQLRVQRQFMDQTAAAYVRVLGSRKRLRVAEENVTDLDVLYLRIQRRARGQLASVADVRLASARLVQARAQLERFEGELTIAESELLALTQIPVVVEDIPESLTLLPVSAELERMAQEQSADVRMKIQRLAVAAADVGREKTASMPTVYLQADRYLNQPGYGNDQRVGVAMDASLDGMGFSAYGRSKAAGSRWQAASEDLSATRNEVGRLVRSLVANRQMQRRLVDSQNEGLTELAEIRASYQRQYEAGFKSWLEVLNVQRELTDQQLQQVQAENDWLMNTLKLAALTGWLDPMSDIKKENP